MIRIEDDEKDTLKDLERGMKFMGNDPHYSKGPFKFLRYIDDGRNGLFWNVNTGEKKVMDMRMVLRGLSCQEWVWC